MPPWTNCVTVAHFVPWDHPSRSHLASRHPAAAARESPGPRHTMYLHSRAMRGAEAYGQYIAPWTRCAWLRAGSMLSRPRSVCYVPSTHEQPSSDKRGCPACCSAASRLPQPRWLASCRSQSGRLIQKYPHSPPRPCHCRQILSEWEAGGHLLTQQLLRCTGTQAPRQRLARGNKKRFESSSHTLGFKLAKWQARATSTHAGFVGLPGFISRPGATCSRPSADRLPGVASRSRCLLLWYPSGGSNHHPAVS